MITSADLSVVRNWPDTYGLGMSSKIVEYQGRYFALLTQYMDPLNKDQMRKLFKADPLFAMSIMSSDEPMIQTWVTEDVWDDTVQDFVPKNDCDDSCDGVQCRKAIAKNNTVADPALAEKMLLDYLNA